MSDARRYLVVTFEAGGNVPVVLGVVGRLVAAGHRVDVLTEPCLREAVQAAGAGFLPFTEYFVREDRRIDLIQDGHARNPIAAMKRAFSNAILGPAGIVADQTHGRIEKGDYDVLVPDVMMPGALIAGEAAGLPTVIIHHMTEYLPGPGRPAPGFAPRTDWIGRLRDGLFARLFRRLLAPFVVDYNAVRKRYGLKPVQGLEAQLHAADRRLIMTSAAFDFPLDPAPANVRYVGPVLDDPDWVGGGWDNPWPADDPRPLVVVGLSSTFQNQADALRRVIRALGTLDVRGLVTLGPAMENERFAVPENVVVVDRVSHQAVFPHAAALVTHAGLGTVMRGLSHGLPMVCLPMGCDQNDNAVRVAHRGAGLKLKPTASSERIAAAIQQILDDPAYRAAAARLGQTLRTEAASGAAVKQLEAVAASRMPTSVT